MNFSITWFRHYLLELVFVLLRWCYVGIVNDWIDWAATGEGVGHNAWLFEGRLFRAFAETQKLEVDGRRWGNSDIPLSCTASGTQFGTKPSAPSRTYNSFVAYSLVSSRKTLGVEEAAPTAVFVIITIIGDVTSATTNDEKNSPRSPKYTLMHLRCLL